MNKTHLDIWAKKVIKETGFVLNEEIRRSFYYSPDKIRNIIFSGLYKNMPAVMRASLVERCLGTVLADITAVDRPKQEKNKRLALVYKFLDELL